MKRQNILILVLLAASLSSLLVALYSLRKARFAIAQADHVLNVTRNQLNSHILREQQDLSQVKSELSLLRLSKIIESSLHAGEQNTFEKALKIRNIIYSQVPLKETPAGFNFMEFDSCFLRSTRNGDVGQLCGGLAILYLTALESQGIPARLVNIFSKNTEPYDGHTTIEFWFDGKWHASDPTFNIMYMDKGKYLSYSDLYERLQTNGSYTIVSNGFTVFPEKGDINAYYISLKDLTKYMVVHPAKVWKDGKEFDYPMTLFPANWDGNVTGKDGKKSDVKMFNTIYKHLYDGILR